jgi:glycosyltransferase involved in cell wall biosynthesis
VAQDDMPALLARYERFVFLPVVIEPFGRLVAEAWASGCEVVTNGLVGAGYWIAEDPEAIETAAVDFWKVVLS